MADHHIPFRKALQWGLECLGHRLLEGIISRLPGPSAFRFGEWIGGILWHLLPSRQTVIRRNLRIAFSDTHDSHELKSMAKASFRRSCGNLISAAHSAHLPPEKLRQILKIENLELLEEALSHQRGVILLLSHMGNWELLSRLVHLLPKGTQTGAFYRPMNNEWFNQQVLDRRQADGTRMFSKRDPFHQVCGFLRNGGLVGILADQRVGRQGDAVTFFDRHTRSSPLPSLLARRTKCKVLALSMVTEAPGQWRAAFLPVTDPPTTQHCMLALQAAMAASPLDVFWLQDRWKVYASRLHSLSEWLSGNSSTPNKKHRVLLWLADNPEHLQNPENWISPEATYDVVMTADQSPPAWLPESSIHRLPKHATRQQFESIIHEIDASAKLPIDFILTPKASKTLLKAAHHEGIDVISLPAESPKANPT